MQFSDPLLRIIPTISDSDYVKFAKNRLSSMFIS
jgi:hypothetical protein